MHKQLSGPTWVMLALVASLAASAPVSAQTAGATTTVDSSLNASTQIASGWSVKKTLLGKTVWNDAGKKVGKVEDLIIAPDRNVSYVIVGAGGFIGIGRHDVAIPISQIVDRAGKLVMPGATEELVKAMPQFTYATDTSRRDQFVAAADKDIALAKARVGALEKQAGNTAAEAKTRIEQQLGELRLDLKSAEEKVAEMKQATAARWKEFEAGVNAATARLRKSIGTATG